MKLNSAIAREHVRCAWVKERKETSKRVEAADGRALGAFFQRFSNLRIDSIIVEKQSI